MYVKVKVFAGVRNESTTKVGDNRYEVKIKDKAERNMANKRVMEIIAEIYKVPINKVKIFSGHHSPSKLLSIYE